jgi:glycosyltransferase involved in cell wall biosynthesis
MNLAPIIIFCYNRLDHLKKTVEALQKNELADESDLFVFSDGYKREKDKQKVLDVRDYIHSVSGFKKVTIIEREKNRGLANSVIAGVTEIINQYGKVIVVEDDLVTSPVFLKYMNECLDLYEKDQRIFSISGYAPPIKIPTEYQYKQYLIVRPCSWGWATWKDRWQLVDWEVSDFSSFIRSKLERKKFNLAGKDLTIMLLKQMTGKINSWAVRWTYSCYKQGKYCVYPVESYIFNAGTDGSGTHFKGNTVKYSVSLSDNKIKPQELQTNKTMIENFQRYYMPSFIRQIINQYKLFRYRLFLQKK